MVGGNRELVLAQMTLPGKRDQEREDRDQSRREDHLISSESAFQAAVRDMNLFR
jgi:hypothetical protein